MNLKISFKNFRTYLTLPEMKVFWIFFGLIVANLGIEIFSQLSWFWVAISAGMLFLVGGVVFYSSLTTARSAYALRLEQHRLHTIVANLKDGIIVYDSNFTILVLNQAAEQIFNLKAQDVLGKTFTLNTKESSESSRFKLFLTVLFPALAPVIHRLSDSNNETQIADLSFTEPVLDLRVTTTKIYNPDGNLLGYMKVVRDRTRDLALLRSKSEFITIASHQLRAPLTAVNWAFETLQREQLNESQKDLVKIGVQAAGNLLKIVNDLLDVAKIEEGRFGYQFQELKVVPFLEDALKQAELVARQYRVQVYLEKPQDENLTIIGDPQRLGTALSNLIDNAIKYNVPNGEVVVKVEMVEREPFVKIMVRDTGIGVPPDVMEKLFTKFFRAENALKLVTEGTGLGLFITKNIIRRHGGKIWVTSELNRGTTFFLTLPTKSDLVPSKEIVYEEEV